MKGCGVHATVAAPIIGAWVVLPSIPGDACVSDNWRKLLCHERSGVDGEGQVPGGELLQRGEVLLMHPLNAVEQCVMYDMCVCAAVPIKLPIAQQR